MPNHVGSIFLGGLGLCRTIGEQPSPPPARASVERTATATAPERRGRRRIHLPRLAKWLVGTRGDRLAVAGSGAGRRPAPRRWRSAAAAPSAGTSGRSSPGRAARSGCSRAGGTGSSCDHLLERLRGRRAAERRPAGQQLVEDRPQGVDVRRPGRSRGPCPPACSGAM